MCWCVFVKQLARQIPIARNDVVCVCVSHISFPPDTFWNDHGRKKFQFYPDIFPRKSRKNELDHTFLFLLTHQGIFFYIVPCCYFGLHHLFTRKHSSRAGFSFCRSTDFQADRIKRLTSWWWAIFIFSFLSPSQLSLTRLFSSLFFSLYKIVLTILYILRSYSIRSIPTISQRSVWKKCFIS